MQKPNPNPSPSKNSTSHAKNSREKESSLKTLVEFRAGDKDTGRGGREDRRVDENGDRVREGQPLKKRKNNEEKENPSAIGHMEEHPNCTSIGSSSKLDSSSSKTTTNLHQFDLNKVDDDVQSMEIEGTSNVALESAEEKVHEDKDLGFDLNELPPKEEGDDVM